MTIPRFIGLHGVAGSGKDTVFERLQALGGSDFVRMSVADPLKVSVAALFDVSLDRLEELKRDPRSFVKLGGTGEPSRATPGAHLARHDRILSVREFLQRYGTESHRDVFGQDFWVDIWERQARATPANQIVVNTSVRFENEADRIINKLLGEVWLIEGPQDANAAGHASEQRLPDHLITRVIDNRWRPQAEEFRSGVSSYQYLDDQLATILHGGPA